MRKAMALLLAAAFAAAFELGFSLEVSAGWLNVLGENSAALSYRGSYPEREFNNPLDFYALEGMQQNVFAGVRLGFLTVGLAAAHGSYRPSRQTLRFRCRNDALGVTISLPAVSLSGWRAGAGLKAELSLTDGFSFFASAKAYFLHSLRTGDYEDDGKIYVVDAPFPGYIFRFEGEDYSNRKVAGTFSWQAAVGVWARLVGRHGAVSAWLGGQLAYESLGWRLLYYDAENRSFSAEIVFAVRK